MTFQHPGCHKSIITSLHGCKMMQGWLAMTSWLLHFHSKPTTLISNWSLIIGFPVMWSKETATKNNVWKHVKLRFPEKNLALPNKVHFSLFSLIPDAAATISKTRWWILNMFYFHPYLGSWSNFANMFQMGRNHQLEKSDPVTICCADILFSESEWCWGMFIAIGSCWSSAAANMSKLGWVFTICYFDGQWKMFSG